MANRNQRETIFATEALSGELCKGLKMCQIVEANDTKREIISMKYFLSKM
jgi:hypothetical protein